MRAVPGLHLLCYLVVSWSQVSCRTVHFNHITCEETDGNCSNFMIVKVHRGTVASVVIILVILTALFSVIRKFWIFLVYVYSCVHLVCVFARVHTLVPETNIRYISQPFSTFSFESGSLPGPGAQRFSLTGGPVVLWASCLHLPCTRILSMLHCIQLFLLNYFIFLNFYFTF